MYPNLFPPLLSFSPLSIPSICPSPSFYSSSPPFFFPLSLLRVSQCSSNWSQTLYVTSSSQGLKLQPYSILSSLYMLGKHSVSQATLAELLFGPWTWFLPQLSFHLWTCRPLFFRRYIIHTGHQRHGNVNVGRTPETTEYRSRKYYRGHAGH